MLPLGLPHARGPSTPMNTASIRVRQQLSTKHQHVRAFTSKMQTFENMRHSSRSHPAILPADMASWRVHGGGSDITRFFGPLRTVGASSSPAKKACITSMLTDILERSRPKMRQKAINAGIKANFTIGCRQRNQAAVVTPYGVRLSPPPVTILVLSAAFMGFDDLSKQFIRWHQRWKEDCSGTRLG